MSLPGTRDSDGSVETRRALVAAAVETLSNDGFAAASARRIAARAQCNQALVFYHYGSVANLLLAALDAVSADRLERYSAAVAGVSTITELAGVAQTIFEEDLDAGYVTVLVEIVGGARSIPGFGEEIARRLKAWTEFAQRAVEATVDPVTLAATLPASEVAYAAVAVYLGLEMLTHLDGDRSGATALFERGRHLLALAEVVGILPTHHQGDAS